MKKSDFNSMKAAIMLTHGFDEIEFITIKNVLEQRGMEVNVVSPSKDLDKSLSIIRSEKLPEEYEGYMLKVKHNLKDVNIHDYQLLVVIGGEENAERLLNNEEARSLVDKFLESKHLIACMSHGIKILSNASFINGRFLTSKHEYKSALIEAGAWWIDEPVVSDKGLITAKTTFDLQEFSLKVLESLATFKVLKEFAGRKGVAEDMVNMSF